MCFDVSCLLFETVSPHARRARQRARTRMQRLERRRVGETGHPFESQRIQWILKDDDLHDVSK